MWPPQPEGSKELRWVNMGINLISTTASRFDPKKWLRSSIETKPYAAVAVALGIGWLIGRMHRPL